jgi:hypothetical protein
MNNKNKKPTLSSEAIARVVQALESASEPFAEIARLTPMERVRGIKLRRGGHQIIPTIAAVAAKYGVAAPDMAGADLEASFKAAQELAAVVSNAQLVLRTAMDAQFNANGETWRAATSLYTMLKTAARSNPDIADEIAPVGEWFRAKRKGSHAGKSNVTDTDAEK